MWNCNCARITDKQNTVAVLTETTIYQYNDNNYPRDNDRRPTPKTSSSEISLISSNINLDDKKISIEPEQNIKENGFTNLK